MERRRPKKRVARCVCGKRAHGSEASAIAHAVDLQARGQDVGHRLINVYICAQSGKWHVGHRPTTGAY